MTKQHSINLDILRGAAALVVVLHHMVSYTTAFDGHFSFGPILNYNFPAHLCVIVFFILSGYVIAVNHPVMANRAEIRSYVRKRLVRILPIYFVSVLFTSLVWPGYSWGTILSNFLFISVPLDNVMIQDSPLWSLNYELIYYFLFIFFSYYRIDLAKTVKVSLVIVAAAFALFHNVKIYPLFISYSTGFIFWITGAAIAKVKSWPAWNISHSRIVSVFLLIFCLQPFNLYGPFFKVLRIHLADYELYSFFQKSLSYNDLFFYPLTILLIMSCIHAASKYNKPLLYITFTLASVRLGMLFYTYGLNYIIREHYVAPAAILVISLLMWFLDFRFNAQVKKVIMSTAVFSRISYALYIIHLPLLFVFGTVGATSWFYFCVKVLVYFITVFTVSYLLEEKFQPFIKKLFRKKLAPATV